MTDFSALLQQGTANAWFFIPSAILLGALHGLEPGHSKTMMAAFIVAIKGTVKQAVLLGLAATVSHTAIVWLIALGGMYISQKFTAEAAEPWFQMISAIIILLTAAWMFWRTWRGERLWKMEQTRRQRQMCIRDSMVPIPMMKPGSLIPVTAKWNCPFLRKTSLRTGVCVH